MKVLIIDDEPIIRRALGRVFKKRGHEVLEAEGGESGLEKWKSSGPDLVFLDVLMPDLNGPQVIDDGSLVKYALCQDHWLPSAPTSLA